MFNFYFFCPLVSYFFYGGDFVPSSLDRFVCLFSLFFFWCVCVLVSVCFCLSLRVLECVCVCVCMYVCVCMCEQYNIHYTTYNSLQKIRQHGKLGSDIAVSIYSSTLRGSSH